MSNYGKWTIISGMRQPRSDKTTNPNANVPKTPPITKKYPKQTSANLNESHYPVTHGFDTNNLEPQLNDETAVPKTEDSTIFEHALDTHISNNHIPQSDIRHIPSSTNKVQPNDITPSSNTTIQRYLGNLHEYIVVNQNITKLQGALVELQAQMCKLLQKQIDKWMFLELMILK